MKRIIGWILVCALLGGLLVCPALAAPFPDVNEDAPYVEAVEYLKNAGVNPDGNWGGMYENTAKENLYVTDNYTATM